VSGLNVVPPDRSHDALAASLLAHGYIIIEELAVGQAAATRDELAPHIEAAPFGHNDFLGRQTKRVDSLLAKSLAARELAIHPIVLAMRDRLLLPS